jgi:glycosyltransferase involved in cell wall biosynthesis
MTQENPCADGTPETRLVSVIIPCLNEVNHIETCIESLMGGDFPQERLEVLVVDGMSDDGTRPILQSLESRYPVMRVLDNPRKIQSAALNIGIGHSKGTVIVRMDAHCEYPTDYVSKLVDWLDRSGADNVGGVWEHCPSADTATARAIAIVLSHPFGVGNASYRTGTSAARWVDTVPFGCYRREVFDRVGLYDEEMVRNEDDELNGRLLRHGGRILLVPDVVIRYFPRESLSKLWRMSYQYGYFKPLVERKIGRVLTLRQLVPAAFLCGIVISGLCAIWSWTAKVMLAVIVGSYTVTIAGIVLRSITRYGLWPSLMLLAAFPTLHFGYGFGFLKGIWDFLILRRKGVRDVTSVPLSR